MRQSNHRPSGMLGFSVVWFGQLVSMTGSGMTRFALTIWVWQETGEATALALVALFSFAPALAGALLALLGINGIMLIDIVTFLFAIGTLLFVLIPNPPETAAGRASRGSLRRESIFGFRYIFSKPSLFGLLLVFCAINLTFTLAMVLFAPMILARTGDNELILGTTMMMFGVGGVVGGVIITAWGGFKRRIHGVLLGIAFSSLFGQVVVGLGQSIQVWALGAFLVAFFMPLINGSSQGIWQAKVPPDIQGKVFATRRLIAQISAPVAMILGGRLADVVFEPAMASGGAFAQFFQPLVGSGPGAGMGLLFVFSGILGAVAALSGYLIPAVRQIETRLPDYDASAATVV